jgi:hypothetical protein
MAKRYLFVATIISIDHLSKEEAKKEALRQRGLGRRAEIFTHEEVRQKGLFEPMQDLTKI